MAKSTDWIGKTYEHYIIDEILKKHFNIKLTLYKTAEEQINIGETLEGVEIKYDGSMKHQLSIEIAEKRNGNNAMWVKSGIYRDDNTRVYIQGNKTKIYIFSKQDLVNYFERKSKLMNLRAEKFPPVNPTIKRYFLPFSEADKLAINIISVNIIKDDNNKAIEYIPTVIK